MTTKAKRQVERVYRQLEGALKRVPDDRRRQLATELAEQADRDQAVGESVSEGLRRAILESGRSVFALSKAADVGYTKLREFLEARCDLRLESVDRLGRVLGLRLVVAAGESSEQPKRK